MNFTKHNFEDGDTLTAKDMNEIENYDADREKMGKLTG